MYVCSCFGITEQQVKQHADSGRCTPREIASACKAGTDCGSCVKRIQGLLGRGAAGSTRTKPAPAEAAPAPAVFVRAEAPAGLMSAEAPAVLVRAEAPAVLVRAEASGPRPEAPRVRAA